jgi:hypothetical protein
VIGSDWIRTEALDSCFDLLTRTGIHPRIKSEGMLRSKTL